MIRLADSRVSEEGVLAVASVLRSGQLIGAQECLEFEQELARFIGVRDVVAVSSGTAALHLAVLAHEIGQGDAVLVPDFTFPASANAVVATGATPVPVDVDPTTYTLDPLELERAVSSWTGPERLRAVMPVHEFGLCADMTAIGAIARAHDLVVIEDAACALGAHDSAGSAGALGDVGCFSFHPRKSLTTGEGGALSTDDADLAARLRRLRNHGMERVNGMLRFTEIGLNYRLTEFQSALGRVGLRSFEAGLKARAVVAGAYTDLLADLVGKGIDRLPTVTDGHSWQTYMLVLAPEIDRDRLFADLRETGVEASVGAQSLTSTGLYPPAPAGAEVGPTLAHRGVALPCHQGMSDADSETVGRALGAALLAQQ